MINNEINEQWLPFVAKIHYKNNSHGLSNNSHCDCPVSRGGGHDPYNPLGLKYY
jgi:hypothetical protein